MILQAEATSRKSRQWPTFRKNLLRAAAPSAIVAMLWAGEASAACTPASPTDGAMVSCTGVPILLPPNPNSFQSNANDLGVVVQGGAIVSTLPGGTAMTIGGSGLTLINLGSIDASAAGSLVLARALAVGNLVTPGSGSTVINNQGSIEGMFDGTYGLTGAAMVVATSGPTTIANSGSIGATALGVFDPADALVVGIYGGGNVAFTNTGSIVGRVAFATPSSGGNTFTNAGTINGSVSLGSALSNDTFVAVTNSSITASAAPQPAVTIPTPAVPTAFLTYAATGTVDAGIGGSDTLVLQNTVAGPGSGSGGSGSISAAQYLNFENLTVSSGTWTLSGAVVSGGATLNGGTAIFDSALAFGTLPITANGGAIQAAVAGLTLAQNVNLAGGLIVQGSNGLTLSGNISGVGGMIKNGAGTLTLTGSNAFSGGLALNGGGLTLGSAGSLGTGLFLVGGAATLNAGFTGTLGNSVQLNGALTVNGMGSLTLAGNINGAGSLHLASGNLSLAGSNTYTGGTMLQGGSIHAGNSGALGTGAIMVLAPGSLTGASGVALGNNVSLASTLTFSAGGGALTLNGMISGPGGLSLAGTPGVTINGANSYLGGTNLGGGTLTVGHNLALGTGAVTVSGASTLVANAGVSLVNTFNLNAGLGIAGGSDLALNGAVVGLGGITKSGTANVTLGGANAFAGGVNLLGGRLTLGTNTSLGLGALTVNGAAALGASSGVNIGNPVVLNANLDIGGSSDIALGSLISGGGALSFNGSGTLALNGSNTFSGGVDLNGGTLSLGNSLGLGAGRLRVGGNARLDTGLSLTLSNFVTLDTGSTLTLTGLPPLTLSGGISGEGRLAIDSSTVTLSGLNTFAGGVGLDLGTLYVTADNALGTGELEVNRASRLYGVGPGRAIGNAVKLNAGAQLRVAGSPDMIISGDIAGEGALIKEGPAWLTLTGDNTYTGGTVIQAGPLQIGDGGTSGSLAGDIVNDGTLFFDRSDASTFAGAISGSGGIEKVGTGTLLLTGDSGSRTGQTFVTAGTLLVGDASGGRLGGNVEVLVGGALGGSGTLMGDVRIAGLLSAGNSPGRLTFAGDLILDGNSRSVFELNTPGVVGGSGAGGNDLVVVQGTLMLGGTLEARVGAAGYYRLFDYAARHPFRFFGAETVTSNNAGFTVAGYQVEYGIAGQINLAVLGHGQALQFWDGADSLGNGTVDGGSGTWSAGANWTGQPGQAQVNGGWLGSVAVFSGTGGAVAVDGTQSFDTLQFSADGYTLSGGALAFAPANGSAATIQVDGNVAATIASALADGPSGQRLVKTGAGTLTLTGANSYTGGTEVQAGTLRGNAASIQGDIANAGTLVFDQAGDAGFAGAIGGLGGTDGIVEKRGAGALTLAGASSLDWAIHEGSLRIAAERFAGDAAVGAAGTLVFDQANDASFAGALAGLGGSHGAAEKRGSGTLTLTGRSEVDWTIAEGSLHSAAERFSGDVAIGAAGAFTFAQTGDAAYAGAISGAGRLAKEGAGTLTLSGDSSGFSGSTDLSGGALVVNGALGGALSVGSGARLGGSGRVGSASVGAGGVLAPGNSIGTLTVAGDLTLAAGSNYEVEVDPAGSASDLVHVTGHATLGGTVTHIGNDGEYRPSASYTILTADGGISGRFGSVTSNYAFLRPLLEYGTNAVTLTLRRNETAFCDISLTANQCAVGSGVESLGPDASLYGAIVALDAAGARAAFEQLSGDIHASSQSALVEDSRFLREAATLRLRRTTGGIAGQTGTGQNGIDSPIAETGLSVWGHGFGSWGHLDGRPGDGTARLRRSTGGLIAGVDAGLDESWRVGVLGGYSNTSLRARSRNASATSDNIHLGLYGGGQIGGIGIRLGAAYSWHDLDTERRVDFADFAPETLDGDYSARSAQLFGEVGYRIAVHDGAFEPFANIAWVHLRSGGFGEDGGTAALHAARSTSDTGFSTVGLRAIGDVWNGLELYGSMGWRHAFGDLRPSVAQAFAGGDVFTITGNPLARNAAVLEAGIDRSVAKGLSLGIAYSGQISDRLQDHGLKGQVRWTF